MSLRADLFISAVDYDVLVPNNQAQRFQESLLRHYLSKLRFPLSLEREDFRFMNVMTPLQCK